MPPVACLSRRPASAPPGKRQSPHDKTIKASQNSAAVERKQVAAFIHDNIQGQNVTAAAAAFHGYGFTETDPDVWLKNGDNDAYIVNVTTGCGQIKSVLLK